MANTNMRRRVKLYTLNESKQWDDKGTGHVSSVYVEKFEGMSLLVRSEDDGSILLESKIQPHTAYQKQQDTLIVWSEAENYDLALSFQEKTGCDEIWEKICQVQGKDPTVSITQEVMEAPEGEDGVSLGLGAGMVDDGEHLEELALAADTIDMMLPPCELSKLEEIAELFNSVLPAPAKREKLSLLLENDNYIKKLLDLFHMCEDLENADGLHHLYEIFKSIFLLNKNALFEIMFADDTLFDVIGVLEYDPSSPEPTKHREYLRTQAKFKEVIPITNTELVQKIHQTYRVQYIQEVILPTPSVFEENMLSTLNSFIYFNKVEIVSIIQEDEKFLSALFNVLTDDDTEDERRRDCTLFLKEFCAFSQTLQPGNKESFFKILSNLGVLGAIEIILGLEDDRVKSLAIDIFSFIVEFSPSMVREYILQESQRTDDDDLLINLVIEHMVTDPDPELGGAVQLMGLIRLLVDPENMLGSGTYFGCHDNDMQGNVWPQVNEMLPSGDNLHFKPCFQKTEKTEFLTFFYKHSMHKLTAPLFANTVEEQPSKDDYKTAQLLSLILELLTFCIEHHTYHCRNYVMNKDLIKRVLVLLKSKHAFLALSALRLFRRTIGLKDDFYNRYIVSGNLFKLVADAFVANGTKYNLLNSAMIELFEFIRQEDVKSLITHIVDAHIKAFENVDYVDVFKNLQTRFNEYQDRLHDRTSLDSMQSLVRHSRFRRDARTLEEEEEIWFEQDEDFEDTDTMTPMADMLKTKLDTDFDQINRFLERNRNSVSRDNEFRDSPPRLFNRSANAINFNIMRSPPTNSPTPTPASSPNSSPANSPSSKGLILEDKVPLPAKKKKVPTATLR